MYFSLLERNVLLHLHLEHYLRSQIKISKILLNNDYEVGQNLKETKLNFLINLIFLKFKFRI